LTDAGRRIAQPADGPEASGVHCRSGRRKAGATGRSSLSSDRRRQSWRCRIVRSRSNRKTASDAGGSPAHFARRCTEAWCGQAQACGRALRPEGSLTINGVHPQWGEPPSRKPRGHS
jgi:hypothetical protein